MLSSGVFTLLLAGLAVAGPVWPRYTVGPEHLEVLQMRASTSVNPAAVRETKCINSKVCVNVLPLLVGFICPDDDTAS